jgi:hypothetical protein
VNTWQRLLCLKHCRHFSQNYTRSKRASFKKRSPPLP